MPKTDFVKIYYIDIVKDSFFALKDFSFDKYKELVEKVLNDVKEKNKNSPLAELLFLSLFSNRVVGGVDFTSGGSISVKRDHDDNVLFFSKDVHISGGTSIVYKKNFTFSQEACEHIKNLFNYSDQNEKELDVKILEKSEFFDTSNAVRKLLGFLSEDCSLLTFFEAQFSDICFLISKSLTVGEYLISDNYTAERLDSIITSNVTEEDLLPPLCQLLERLKAIISQVRTFSKTIGYILKNQDSGSKAHPIYIEGFKSSVAYSYNELLKNDFYSVWAESIEAISLLSYIDFAFVSTTQNVETLSSTYSRLPSLKKYYGAGKYGSRISSEITEPNMAKALMLLQFIVNKHDISLIDNELEPEILLHDPKMIDLSKEMYAFDFKYTTITPDFISMRRSIEADKSGHSDVKRYNQIGIRYCTKKIKQKRISDQICDKDHIPQDIIQSISELLDNEDDLWTVSFLVSIIRKLSIQIKHCLEYDNLRKLIYLLNRLLDKLREIADEYRNGDIVPGKIVKPFAKSFYNVTYSGKYIIEEGNNIGNFDNTPKLFDDNGFVFISTFCKEISPVVLDFIYGFITKYERAIYPHQLRAQQMYITYLNETHEEAIKKSQSQSMQLLGILAAFIALISVGAGVDFDSESSWQQFFMFTSCIVLLLLCIFFIFEKNKKWPSIIFAVLLVLYLMFFLFTDKVIIL